MYVIMGTILRSMSSLYLRESAESQRCDDFKRARRTDIKTRQQENNKGSCFRSPQEKLTVRIPPSWLFSRDRHLLLTSMAQACDNGDREEEVGMFW